MLRPYSGVNTRYRSPGRAYSTPCHDEQLSREYLSRNAGLNFSGHRNELMLLAGTQQSVWYRRAMRDSIILVTAVS